MATSRKSAQRGPDATRPGEEFIVGLIAVAVPVVDRHGQARAAIAMHAPVARMTIERAQACLPRLRQAALDLGKQF